MYYVQRILNWLLECSSLSSLKKKLYRQIIIYFNNLRIFIETLMKIGMAQNIILSKDDNITLFNGDKLE
jgi:hypothetical protein